MDAGGYYRSPTIHGSTVVFGSEDDLWTVSSEGGIARRLTSGLGGAHFPAVSPDGQWLAFAGREEGPPEVFVMPLAGGVPRRVTFVGSAAIPVGWTPQGQVVYWSWAGQPFAHMRTLFAVSPQGGEPQQLATGPA